MDAIVPSHPILPVTLPDSKLINGWLAQYHVPAMGIGLVAGDKATVKVYGELSKGIPAPQNTIWGSEAIADALRDLINKINDPDTSLPLMDVFEKLDMYDTFFGDPISVLGRMARQHNKREGIYVFKSRDIDRHLYTTLNDICKLLINVNNRVGATPPGKGITIVDRAGGNGASHSILLFPESKQAVIIFTNSDNGSRIEDRIFESWKLNVEPLL